MRGVSFCLIFLLIGVGCSKKEKELDKREISSDFEFLMGSHFPAWEYVRTQEDFENLHFFKTIYESNISYLGLKSNLLSIPKVVHFIWIGVKPFPRDSIENVRSWIAKHPNWIFKFWTDRPRALPHPQMQEVRIQDLRFTVLEKYYRQSDNYGEQSDLLRYEILFQEGGVYVDHDVKCLRSFEELNKAYNFYCGMELPRKTSLSSSVLPTNSIIGSSAGHPILKYCINWLDECWDRVEKAYPGRDRDSVINRVSHRTFLALGEAFKQKAMTRDIALPTFYFNAPQDDLAIFARHYYKGTWFENESTFEKLVRERLMKISKKVNKILLFLGLFSFTTLAGGVLLWIQYRKIIKRT